MTPKQLLTRVRTKLGDHQKVLYSDYQLVNAYNDSLALIENDLTSRYNQYLLRKTTITVEDGQATLPEDFVSVYEINLPRSTRAFDSGYEIIDNTLYYPEDGEYTLVYYHQVTPITDIDDPSPLPPIFDTLIENLILNQFGQNNNLETIISNLRYTLANGTHNKLDVQVPKWSL